MRVIKKFVALAVVVAGLFVFAAMCMAGEKPLPYMDYTLTPEQRAQDLVSRLTNEEKVSLLSETAEAIPRLGVMRYYHGNEALHGVVRPGKYTVFPMAIALASTWDQGLILRVATAISDEARGQNNANNREITNLYSGLLTFWSPTVNMARDPRWGRTPETYGEDPFLTSRIGVNFVRGLQGDDPKYIKVVSTPKHFAGNNEEHNRMECNAKMSERALREYYLPAFRYLITDGKAESIMGAYNAINGVPCNANKMLLTDILRNEWGFDGYVVTDCGAVQNLIQWHKYSKNGTDAAAAALNAGVDLECGGDAVMKNRLLSSLAAGLVTQEAIDQAAYRVLRGRFRLGMFDPPEMVKYNSIPGSVVGSAEHQKLSLETARESIVLLQNRALADGSKLLPIDAGKVKSIAVMGPNVALARFGDYSGSSVIQPVTPLDGIKDRAGSRVSINYIPWVSAPTQNDLVAIPAELLKADGMEGSGLKGEYFSNTKMTGVAATVRLDAKADVDTLNHAPDPGIPHGGFSARWTATLTPEMSGGYVLGFTTEGGAKLILDGEILLERAAPKKNTFKAGQAFNVVTTGEKIVTLTKNLQLEAGKQYRIEFDYVSAGGNAVAKLLWIAPAADREKARREGFDAAARADVVIAVMGIGLDQEREGVDRDTLDLPADQHEFLAELTKRNPRTVLVLVNGSPMSIVEEAKEAPAVVEAWYGGENGGAALADVLFGNYNPAGRLPLTFYKSVSELPPFDDYEVSRGRTYMYSPNEPLFAFGHGLSYTTFDYSGVSADRQSVGADGVVNVSFDVKNAGGMSGDEVAQLYVKPVNPPVKMPNIMLRGFTRVNIKSGETKHVVIPLDVKELGYWDADAHKFMVAPGKYELLVGSSSRDIRLRTTVEVK